MSKGPLITQPAGVRGLDVSGYQRGLTSKEIEWSLVAAAGYEFAICKVADGAKLDETFWPNWLGVFRAGMVRGCYIYFRPNRSAEEQAALVLSTLAHHAVDLPPVLDLETAGNLGTGALVAQVERWVDMVERHTDREPILYCGPGFWAEHMGEGSNRINRLPLWVADYSHNPPWLPFPWKHRPDPWQFWQWTDKGEVPGIKGNVDLNVWRGSSADLRAFAAGVCGSPLG